MNESRNKHERERAFIQCPECKSLLEFKEGYDFYEDYRRGANYYYCRYCDDYFDEEDFEKLAKKTSHD